MYIWQLLLKKIHYKKFSRAKKKASLFNNFDSGFTRLIFDFKYTLDMLFQEFKYK